MASPAGIEPATYALGGRRAILLCHGDKPVRILSANPDEMNRCRCFCVFGRHDGDLNARLG